MNETGVFTHPSRYIVTVLPGEYESYEDWYLFVVTVQYRGRGKWAVYQGAYESSSLPTALSASGEWGYEGSGDRENEAWLERHRFDLETAMALAKQAAPGVGIYDHRVKRYITAAEVAEERRKLFAAAYEHAEDCDTCWYLCTDTAHEELGDAVISKKLAAHFESGHTTTSEDETRLCHRCGPALNAVRRKANRTNRHAGVRDVHVRKVSVGCQHTSRASMRNIRVNPSCIRHAGSCNTCAAAYAGKQWGNGGSRDANAKRRSGRTGSL